MLRELVDRRGLVWAFVKRDRSVRFRSSGLGWLWSLIQPLANLIFFSIVFSVIFEVPAPPLGNGQGASYPAFLFCGMVTWNLFAGLQLLSIQTLRSCADLLRKVAFPGWAPIIGAQVVQTLQGLMEVAVLIVFLLVLGNVGWTWLLAIPILVGTVLFAQGVGLMCAALSTRFGDVKEIVTVVLGVLYFATPILYPMSMLEGSPSALALLISLNPLSWYVQGVHDTMYSLSAPPAWQILLLLAGGMAVFWMGLQVFSRMSRNLVEML